MPHHKIMKKTFLFALVPLTLLGCNAGNAPAGGSDEEIKSTFESMSVEDKAKFYMNSPMPTADKRKKIEEAYQKAGKPVPPELESQLGGGAAPQAGSPPVDTGQHR